tara:strand:+ start:3379 stop:3663 length:285 start_codon:yes stop_codon:yes gene_type:complete
MSKINLPYKHYIPYDIVNLIADYHDYEKYCKPSHYENLKHVLKDIIDMTEIMPIQISPRICIQCWGTRGITGFYHESDEEYYDDFEYEGGGWYN